MKVQNQYVPSGNYSPSLERIYLSSSVDDSRIENRRAVLLHVVIVVFLVALIGLSAVR